MNAMKIIIGFFAVLGFLTVFLFLITIAYKVINESLGYVVLSSIGNSMRPSILPGSYISILETHTLDKGEVGCYIVSDDCAKLINIRDLQGKLVCHRVVNKTNNIYTFKADNSDEVDGCEIYPKDIFGKITESVPLLGIFDRLYYYISSVFTGEYVTIVHT